jgi:hypothetical protein
MSRNYKPLSIGRLPRVMVAILAMDEDNREMIVDALRTEVEVTTGQCRLFGFGTMVKLKDLAACFHMVLQLPKGEREAYVSLLNRALNGLCQQDAFGTEGQLDPRGDHRD